MLASVRARVRPAVILCAIMALLWANTPGRAAAAQTPVVDPRFDLTGNQLVTAADTGALINAWTLAQEQNQCAVDGFANADLNGDGCIDIADVQGLAAQMGNATNRNAPQLAASAAAAAAIPPITLAVNAATSEDDALPGDGVCRTALGTCTLRAALVEANNRPGPERITFAIPSSKCATVTIKPQRNVANFFTLEDQTGPITIDGYTQCGAKANTAATAGNAVLRVEIDGGWTDSAGKTQNAALGVDGITIMSPNNVVRGLALLRWDHAFMIMNREAQFNHLEGNFIGSNAAQTFDRTTGSTHHYEGIRLRLAAAYNVIGCGTFPGGVYTPCTDPALAYAARNVVAGNGNDGIHLQGDGGATSPHHNHIVGNIVGLKQNGATVLRNHSDGVDFEQGPYENWLGGETALERNILTANGSEGIEISHNTHTTRNYVVGNYFGLDVTGTTGILNSGNGISFEDTVDQNYAYNNVIAGNYGNGVRFYVAATRNEVHDNLIGVAADGVTAIPNGATSNPYGQDGVFIMGGSQRNIISRNLIAHSPSYGVEVDPISDGDHGWAGPTWYNTISQNTIFDSGKAAIRLKSKAHQTSGVTFYGNQKIAQPSISRAGTNYVSGKACAFCTVEVFIADPNSAVKGAAVTHTSGDGKTFVGAGLAGADGIFNVLVNGVAVGNLVTATATDPQGNTSEFATNKAVQSAPIATLVPGPALTPTPALQATATAFAASQTAAAQTAQAQSTATASATATATATAQDTATATPQDATATAEATPTDGAINVQALQGSQGAAPASNANLPSGTYRVLLPMIGN